MADCGCSVRSRSGSLGRGEVLAAGRQPVVVILDQLITVEDVEHADDEATVIVVGDAAAVVTLACQVG